MLFILVADALQRFIANATESLSGTIVLPPKALQFADDTVIIMEAHPSNLTLIARILRNFAALTGLSINANKSVFVPVAVRPDLVPVIRDILHCQPKEFPITYLGLPLSIRKPRKVHFQPLLVAIQKKIQGWKARFLSLAGRLTLVKSVLTAMPLHFMQVIKLPEWLVKNIDKLRRNFLWRGDKNCLGGHCLVNWKKCCLLKQNGGLGILNIRTQNEALLARWIWMILRYPDSPWTQTILQLYGSLDVSKLFDNPLVSSHLLDILRTNGVVSISIQHSLTDPPRWKWTTDGQFSVASVYRLMSHTGVVSEFHSVLWKIKAPPKVKVFLWLLLTDKLLTQQNLRVRGWPTEQHCVLCDRQEEETTQHLFQSCPFAENIWELTRLQFNLPLRLHSPTPLTFWQSNRRRLPPDKKQLWNIIWSAMTWTMWKQRCKVIFQNEIPSLYKTLIDGEILVRSWSRAYGSTQTLGA